MIGGGTWPQSLKIAADRLEDRSHEGGMSLWMEGVEEEKRKKGERGLGLRWIGREKGRD